MLKSMTGFGKAAVSMPGKDISVEIKTLNSKQADISLRLPNAYGPMEAELRSLISGRLRRGKIYCQINIEYRGAEPPVTINKELALRYIEEFKQIRTMAGGDIGSDFISVITRMPEVIVNKSEEVSDEEYMKVKQALIRAMEDVDKFRTQEGELLEKDFRKRIALIDKLLQSITPFEEKRLKTVRERLEAQFSHFSEKFSVDENRFEQELIYYLEKLDITEEKIRLQKHCDYFMQTLESKEQEKGKKLGFVLQEIGREINTIGSKANDAVIQKIVVEMKDETEKIKEQMMNIL